MLSLSFSIFAKKKIEKKLQVTKQDWGYSVSNIDENGQIICTGSIKLKIQDNVFIIWKGADDTFNIDKIIEKFATKDFDSQFQELYHGVFDNIQVKNGYITPMIQFTDLIIISTKEKISEVKALQKNEKTKDLELSISIEPNSHSNVETLIQEKKIEIEKKQSEEEERLKAEKAKEQARLEAERKELENARTDSFDSYDNIKWGTSYKNVVKLLGLKSAPALYEQQAAVKYFQINNGKQNNINTSKRYFFFENDKGELELFCGETEYTFEDISNLDCLNDSESDILLFIDSLAQNLSDKYKISRKTIANGGSSKNEGSGNIVHNQLAGKANITNNTILQMRFIVEDISKRVRNDASFLFGDSAYYSLMDKKFYSPRMIVTINDLSYPDKIEKRQQELRNKKFEKFNF